MTKEFRFGKFLKNFSGCFKLKYVIGLFNELIYIDNVFALIHIKVEKHTHMHDLIIFSWGGFQSLERLDVIQVLGFDASLWADLMYKDLAAR